MKPIYSESKVHQHFGYIDTQKVNFNSAWGFFFLLFEISNLSVYSIGLRLLKSLWKLIGETSTKMKEKYIQIMVYL